MSIFSWIKDNWMSVAATVVTTIATAGTNLIATAVAFGVGYLLDADRKQREQEDKKLALSGKAGETIRIEVNGLQDQRSRDISLINTLSQQLAQKQAKLNDPNVSEEEKAQIRSEIASIISQSSNIEQRIKDYDKKIADLLGRIPGANKPSQEIDTQKLLIIGGACLVVYLLVVKDKDNS